MTNKSEELIQLSEPKETVNHLFNCESYDYWCAVADFWNEKKYDLITEASLGRVLQHVNDIQKTSFIQISACKSASTQEDRRKNNENTKKLKQMVSNMKLGYFSLIGHYFNEKTQASEEEDTLFVIGITREQAVKLVKEFDQDSVLYAGPESDGKVVCIDRNNKIVYDLGPFHPNRIGKYYSTVKGKNYIFECGLQSISEARIKDAAMARHGDNFWKHENIEPF